MGRPTEAEAELRKALAGNPNQGLALLELAKLQRSSGKITDAINTLAKMSALPDPQYRAYHAQFLFQNGQKDTSSERSFYRRRSESARQARLRKRQFASARNPGRAHYLLAKVHQARNRPLEYRNELKLATDFDPALVPAFVDLLENLRNSKSFPGALSVLDRLPAGMREQPAVLVERGWVLLALGRQAEAKAIGSRAGDLSAARAAYTASLANDSEYPLAIVANARMEMMQGQWGAAKSRVENLLAKDRSNVDARLALAMGEEGAGNRDAAIKAYREVFQARSSNLTALNNLIMLLCENPSTADEAVMLGRQLKGAAPNNPLVDDTVGWAYYKKGNYPMAIEFLERAARAREVQPKYRLAMAYFSAGKKDLGQRVLSAALQIDPNVPEAKAAQSLAASKK